MTDTLSDALIFRTALVNIRGLKLAQDELSEANNLLEQRVIERTQALERSNVQLREELTEKE